MKSILVACDKSSFDTPLRRSLAHLAKSCYVCVAHNGDTLFDELSDKAFDLIIIDFEVSGADSLELVESVQYIDPGVPVILMLKQAHQAVEATARHLKAHPISRPFKPLDFLRLVDKLLHQQLNRYRRLAELLKGSLEQVRLATEGLCAFLADESGQILISSGEVGGLPLESLASLLTEPSAAPPVFHISIDQARALFAYDQVDDYGLFITPVAETLSLALLAPVAANPLHLTPTWHRIDQAALTVRDTLRSQAPARLANIVEDGDVQKDTSPGHTLIPVILRADYTAPEPPPAPAPEADDEATLAVNWTILSNNSDLLNRLQKFCQIS